MAEISAVTAARAAVLRNDTRNLHRQELRNAERLQQERQADLDKRARIIEDQLSLDRRRPEQGIDLRASGARKGAPRQRAPVNERRAEEIDSQVRQEVDLQLAQDRINEANFDPERPSGTLVDVFG